MFTQQKVQNLIGIILLVGTLAATLLVLIGGTLYLLQNGSDTLQSELLQMKTQQVTVSQVWQYAFSFTPLGTVQLGLLLLISTQSIRVLLLCWFYTVNRDYPFAMISLFILLMLIYSSCWRHT